MTWTLTNTIADSSTSSGTAESHTAMQYLFDTYLPAKGWTVSAHPDASAYKRVFSRTTAANMIGQTLPLYYWANWSSVTPNTLNVYADLTYTSTPGDVANNTSVYGSMNWNSASYIGAGLPWRFWSSDQDTGATLVTRGKKVYWYMPDFQNDIHAMLLDTDWDGSSQNQTTCVMPFTNQDIMRSAKWPMYTNTSNGRAHVRPNAASYNNVPMTATHTLIHNITWVATNGSSAYNDSSTQPLFVTGNDVSVFRNTVDNYTMTFWNGPTVSNTLLLSNGRYYLCTNNSSSLDTVGGNGSIAFDMGTTEPDFS